MPRKGIIGRIVTDLKGPVSIAGPNGERYMQLFTDIDTKYRIPKCMEFKSQALDNLKELISVDLASESLRLVEYHSDGAPELISKDIVSMLAANGTRLSYSPPYIPELNGVSEQSNRTIWDSAMSMWADTCLPA